jgi:predicted metal-binding protein
MSSALKSYPAPWHGRLLLACQKCQKKLKRRDELKALAKLKKTVKQHNRNFPQTPLHVVNVPCLDLCPKDGVAACLYDQAPAQLVILRSLSDLELLAGLTAHTDEP